MDILFQYLIGAALPLIETFGPELFDENNTYIYDRIVEGVHVVESKYMTACCACSV